MMMMMMMMVGGGGGGYGSHAQGMPSMPPSPIK